MSPTRSHTLLVDGSAEMLQAVQATLSDLGARHQLVAITEAETWAFLRQTGPWLTAPRPDLILLDLSAPSERAWALLAGLKGAAEFRRIPIVVWVAGEDQAGSDRAYDLHANACVAQPPDAAAQTGALRAVWSFWLDVVKRSGA
jgi:chemotaxis family two-component system response regulator Rcp1